MFSIKNLQKHRPDGQLNRQILSNLTLDVSVDESIAIMGDSGSGKSTLLNIIAGLEAPDSGEIWHNGEAIHTLSNEKRAQWRKQQLGVVFQQFNLIECLSVEDNIKFPARLNKNQDHDWFEEISERLNIRSLWRKPVQNISGGEQQRVAVARAVAHKPAMVLADEPTGNLDNHNAIQVADLLCDICHTSQTPLILVTHSRSIAAKTDRCLVLADGKLEPTDNSEQATSQQKLPSGNI